MKRRIGDNLRTKADQSSVWDLDTVPFEAVQAPLTTIYSVSAKVLGLVTITDVLPSELCGL